MKTPCEEIVWYVIPTIRAEFARSLTSKYGLKQKEVARMLGITDAAISQYVKGKRGGYLTDPAALKAIDGISREVAEGSRELTSEDICHLCKIIREGDDYPRLVSKGITCDI